MATEKKSRAISRILSRMERDLEALRSRLGGVVTPEWDDMNRKEQNDELLAEWPEVVRLWRGLR